MRTGKARKMNIRVLITCLALGLLVAGGCAGPDVRTDFDPSADFSAFRSFAYLGITDRGYEVGVSDKSPLRRRIEQLVEEQLVAKGVPQVNLEASPDLLVHLFFGVKGKQQAQKTSMTPGLLGRGYGWGPGYYAGHVSAYEYHEGTWTPIKNSRETIYEDHEGVLIVDLAVPSKKELVWRAVIRAVMTDNLEENFELADKGIAKAFKNYPPDK
ncbi:hypothetical protein AYO43_02460 [Nitrospira sp. SCGC AG-212-E16]|nr:hypothetical protein AYO43_02460 [Nitrospira sp. SCGC AG-212-E16]